MLTTSSLRYMVEMTGVEPAWTCSQSKRVTVTLHLDIKIIEPKDSHLWEQWLDSCLQLLPNSLQATNRVYQVTLFFHINVIIQKLQDSNLCLLVRRAMLFHYTKFLKKNYSCTVTVNMALYSLLNMELAKGLEPSTYCLQGNYSTTWVTPAYKKVFQQNLRQQKTEVYKKMLRL